MAAISCFITVLLIVVEYIKNNYLQKEWYSKLLSFFVDLMLTSIVMAVLFLIFHVEKMLYMCTLITLPFYSAFKAYYSNKYLPLLVRIDHARKLQEFKYKEALRMSAERAALIRKEKRERLERINTKHRAKKKKS